MTPTERTQYFSASWMTARLPAFFASVTAGSGTIANQVAVTPPDRKSVDMQAVPAFPESVRHIRNLLDQAGRSSSNEPSA